MLEWLDGNANELSSIANESPQLEGQSTADHQIMNLRSVQDELREVWNRQEESSDKDPNMGCIRAPKDSFTQLPQRQLPGNLLGISVARGSRNLLFWSVDSPTVNLPDHKIIGKELFGHLHVNTISNNCFFCHFVSHSKSDFPLFSKSQLSLSGVPNILSFLSDPSPIFYTSRHPACPARYSVWV